MKSPGPCKRMFRNLWLSLWNESSHSLEYGNTRFSKSWQESQHEGVVELRVYRMPTSYHDSRHKDSTTRALSLTQACVDEGQREDAAMPNSEGEIVAWRIA